MGITLSCVRVPIFSRFDTTVACDGHTDMQTHDDGIFSASIASCGNNLVKISPVHSKIMETSKKQKKHQ